MRKLLRLLLIMLLTIVWTASRAQEITMDFTDNSGWNIPVRILKRLNRLAKAIMLLRYRVDIVIVVHTLV